MTMISPDNLLAAGKAAMLEGREPETERDWALLVNFFSANIKATIQPSAVLLMCRLYDVPLSDGVIEKICSFQTT